MSIFNFQAKTLDGKVVKGEVDATNESEARVKIRGAETVLTRIVFKGDLSAQGTQVKTKAAAGFSLGGGIKPKELQIFTRQFATLLGAGVPIVQSLEALIGPGKSPNLNKALTGILEEVSKGKRLAEALRNYPKVFDTMYVNLISAGEESGVLDTILNRLAAYIEKSVKLRGKIKGALTYPAVVIFVACLVVAAIMIFVIPTFVSMFKQGGMELPWLTLKVMGVSDFFVHRWYLIVGAAVGIPFSLMRYYETPEGRKTIDIIMLKLPLFGDLIRKGAVARFSRTLSTMLTAGVRIVEALNISSSTTKNWVIEQVLLQAADSISKGRTLSEPIKNSREIPHMVGQMIAVGEQTGSLDQMLDKVANFYEDEVETAAGALTSMIEPLLMVFLGGIIAVIMIAMYLPIFNMAGAAAKG